MERELLMQIQELGLEIEVFIKKRWFRKPLFYIYFTELGIEEVREAPDFICQDRKEASILIFSIIPRLVRETE